MNAPSDRDLLLGIIALEMNFISRDSLMAAVNEWLADKSKSLGKTLLAQKAISQVQFDLLTSKVEEQLSQNAGQVKAGDLTRSPASDGTVQLTREQQAPLVDRNAGVDQGATTLQAPPAGNDVTPLDQTLLLSDTKSQASKSVASVIPPKDSRFRPLRPWREGGLGTVCIAIDEELHREVALKEIKPQHAANKLSQDRFLIEAEVTGSLEHPGIVPVYGMGRYKDGRPYYAMRFVHGASLEEAIHEFHQAEQQTDDSSGQRAVKFRELLSRFIAVCNAIAYAHSRGVLHRDLKPGNILLAKYGETLVVDWGLAKVAGQNEQIGLPTDENLLELQSGTGTAPTRLGSVIGTPAFMSPEQAEGRLDLLGPATDIYSLGATLYCLLTGCPPLGGMPLDALLAKLRKGDFPRPRQVKADVPRPLEAICLKAMSLKREDRYPTASALADDLEHWLADEPVSAYQELRRERAARWARRHRALAFTSAIALLVVAVVSVAAVVLVNRQRQIAAQLAEDNNQLAIQERAAKEQSEIAFHEARDAVDDLFTKVSEDSLLNSPGMQGLRNDLLQKTLDYYQRFLNQKANDPAVKEEYAATLFRAGRIIDELQSPEKAIPYLQQALDLQRQLHEETPQDAKRLKLLADTQNALGGSLHRSQQFDEARKAYQAGRELRQQLAELDPQNIEYQRVLANSVMNIGLVEKDSGQLDSAAELLDAAQQIRQKLIAAATDSAKLQRDLAMGFYNQGILDLKMIHPEAAVQHFDEAIAQFQQIEDRDPRDLTAQFLLATCYRLSGDAQSKRESHDESLRLYQLAQDGFARLVDRNPEVAGYRSALASVYASMARLQEPALALANLEKARSIFRQLASEYPANPQFRSDLAITLRELAVRQIAAGQRELGRDNLRSSIDLLQKLIEQFPKNKDFADELEKSRLEWTKAFTESAPVESA